MCRSFDGYGSPSQGLVFIGNEYLCRGRLGKLPAFYVLMRLSGCLIAESVRADGVLDFAVSSGLMVSPYQ